MHKLKSHLAAQVNEDIPVTELTPPQVQDGPCYSHFVLHHGKTIGFGIIRPGFKSQVCHSLAMSLALNILPQWYYGDGIKNAFLRIIEKSSDSSPHAPNLTQNLYSLPLSQIQEKLPGSIQCSKKPIGNHAHSPFPHFPQSKPCPSPVDVTSQYVRNLCISLSICCHTLARAMPSFSHGLL